MFNRIFLFERLLLPCHGLLSLPQGRERVTAFNLSRGFSGFPGTSQYDVQLAATLRNVGGGNQVTRSRLWHVPQGGGLVWVEVSPAEERACDSGTERAPRLLWLSDAFNLSIFSGFLPELRQKLNTEKSWQGLGSPGGGLTKHPEKHRQTPAGSGGTDGWMQSCSQPT